MKAFVDLQGASGAVYRFRLAPGGVVSTPIAGNYAYVREAADGVAILSVAATNDLSSAMTDWKRAVAKYGEMHLYTRLNVSAAVREAEQRDIAAHYKPRLTQQRSPERAPPRL
ncbi:hypothetical protein [Phenylobacterium sp.]|uniref:hypothetical protein n=1 Tax=Phenylobacterium sp. TaxID=1871053 RepID=UPI0035624E93